MRHILIFSVLLCLNAVCFAMPPAHYFGKHARHHHFRHHRLLLEHPHFVRHSDRHFGVANGIGASFLLGNVFFPPFHFLNERITLQNNVFYSAPPVLVIPQVPNFHVPIFENPPHIEKAQTKLFCRSQNDFFPKVRSCAEGWLEVVNR